MRLFSGFCGAVFGLALASVPALAAEKPVSLGAFKDWSAYSAGTGADKICYALALPLSSEPRGAKRDPIYFIVSDFPSRKAKGEPQIVPGYPYKDGGTVTVAVGSDKFTFFTKTETGAGSAWMKSPAEEARLISAMQRGSRAIVTGISSRGTLTTDTYSLSGITAALNKVHAECKM